jgi:predicted HTH domain antitoxin
MIAIDLPEDIEAQLRAGLGRAPDQVAREALILEGYKTAALSIGQVARLLEYSIDQAYGFLKAHGIAVNYTADDFDQDLSSLRKLFPKAAL